MLTLCLSISLIMGLCLRACVRASARVFVCVGGGAINDVTDHVTYPHDVTKAFKLHPAIYYCSCRATALHLELFSANLPVYTRFGPKLKMN